MKDDYIYKMRNELLSLKDEVECSDISLGKKILFGIQISGLIEALFTLDENIMKEYEALNKDCKLVDLKKRG